MQVTREVGGKLSSPRESENGKAEKRCGHMPLLRRRALIDPTALGEPERNRRPHVHTNGKQVLSMALFFWHKRCDVPPRNRPHLTTSHAPQSLSSQRPSGLQ